jgi:hypothetical protein
VAETPPFAAEPNHAIQAASTAMDANETSRQNSTIEERTEFGLDKAGDVPVAVALSSEKRFQMSGDNLV